MTKSIVLAGILISAAAAQPPGIIRVIRNGSIRYAEARASVGVLGMSAISGFSETWQIELHDSFASLEDLDKALNTAQPPSGSRTATPSDDLLTPSKALIATYRPNLSYRPDQAVQNLPKTRYFDVVIYRIRPGTETEFGRFLKLRGASQDSVNLDRPDMVYQVISGEAAGTYFVLTPLPSLRVLDDARARTPVYADGDLETARKIAADSGLIREHLWFRVEPGMSYVSDEFASADSDFWRGPR